MKLSKIFLLFLFVVNINANSVNSGHAEISLIKYNQSELSNDKNLIGIKMDMQKNFIKELDFKSLDVQCH